MFLLMHYILLACAQAFISAIFDDGQSLPLNRALLSYYKNGTTSNRSYSFFISKCLVRKLGDRDAPPEVRWKLLTDFLLDVPSG